MQPFTQVLIGGYPSGGLMTDRKPMMLPDEAFSNLENAYVFRQRVKKRDGLAGMAALQRLFSGVNIGNTGASPWSFNIYTALGIVPETDAEINPGSVKIAIATIPTPFLDQGDGTITNATAGNSGTINYLTGNITLIHTAGIGQAVLLTAGYLPHLPVMGINRRDIATIGIDQTIFFDTTYAYIFTGGNFQELSPPTTWTGNKTQFFWSANYQGADTSIRYLFVTNNNIDINLLSFDPIRYFDNSVWVDFQPLVTATQTLFQARIIIPYYGRLLMFNTWEGSTGSGFTGSANFFSRCRFSQIGNPVAVDAWRSDIFGKGGFIDAPTNEAIVSVAFFRNTLIVFFEYSTWQLRYVGEYGLPFIFERISSDFGSVSTFSSVIFDEGVFQVSNRGIISAASNGIKRLDEQIPETIFGFEIQDDAPNFVHGVRDFQKEIVFWNYLDVTSKAETQNFPNSVLLFNYRNNTWAKFRDSITCFGIAQFQIGITWDSLVTFWEDLVTWDNVDNQNYVDYVTAGNQQGFIFIYEDQDAAGVGDSDTLFSPTLFIKSIDFSASPNELTVPEHNLEDGEFIYITDTAWSGVNPGINNFIYKVVVIDKDTISLALWDGTSYPYVSKTSMATYLGAGRIALLPIMNIVTKDFNPFQGNGKQFKLSEIDFLMDQNLNLPSIAGVTIQLFVNAYLGAQANMITDTVNKILSNGPQAYGLIQGTFKTNPCKIKSINHSLQNGDMISIANIIGMTQLNNGNYTITVVDANNFTLNGIDATGFTDYVSGGIWNTIPSDGQVLTSGSDYAWYSFYATQRGQYLRIGLTYDDVLINQLATHQTPLALHAMNCYFRQGGPMTN